MVNKYLYGNNYTYMVINRIWDLKKILIENSLCSPVFHLTDDNTSPIEGSRCGGKKYDRSKRSRDNIF